MAQFLNLFSSNSTIFILVDTAAVLITLLMFLILLVRHARLSKKYDRLVRGMTGKNLEEILMTHLSRVDKAVDQVKEISVANNHLRKMAERSIQKVGVVRFNAFADTGSDLSFAVAMLDNFGDGVVFSSIFGRDDQRTYVKPVQKGSSTYHLSEEEKRAISAALQE